MALSSGAMVKLWPEADTLVGLGVVAGADFSLPSAVGLTALRTSRSQIPTHGHFPLGPPFRFR
jgi:hypothetical protein